MKSLVDILLEEAKENKKYFDNYLDYAQIIKKEAGKLLGKVKVYIFGSIVKGDFDPSSDIDILIVAPKQLPFSRRTEVKVKIYEKIGFFSPFELHLINEEEYQSWYKNFLKDKIEVF